MDVSKELTTVTTLSKIIALALFLLLPLFGFIFGMQYQSQINELKKGAPQHVACTMEAKLCPDGSSVSRFGPNCEFAPCPVNISVVPTSTTINQPSTTWKTYNYKSNGSGIDFSMLIPYVGVYCEGCFDGTSGIPDGSSLRQISGGYDDPTSDRKWLIVIAVYDKAYESNALLWGIPPHSVFIELKKMIIGETKNFISNEFDVSKTKTPYFFKRLTDTAINGITAQTFETDLNSGVNLTKRNVILFEKNNKDVMISFEYQDPKYDSFFEKIIASIKFQLLSKADYE